MIDSEIIKKVKNAQAQANKDRELYNLELLSHSLCSGRPEGGFHDERWINGGFFRGAIAKCRYCGKEKDYSD